MHVLKDVRVFGLMRAMGSLIKKRGLKHEERAEITG